jgi:hypothetical protein
MITGWEEILGYLADRLGLDLRGRSAVRKLVIIALYAGLGLVLLAGGGHYAVVHANDGIALVSGIICALVGIAYVIRITINIFKDHARSRS